MEIYFAKVYQWIEETKEIAPYICDWIGVYFKESYLYQIESNDLVVGPYIGEETDHIRIPLGQGLCGLALREERIVNVGDVSKDLRHIACSSKTKSELVVPIADSSGNFVAELDIDCNRLNAFSLDFEKKIYEAVKRFPLLENYIPFNMAPLESERLIIRKLEEDDSEAIYSYCKNPNVARHVTWMPHQSLRDSMKLVNFAKLSYEKGSPECLGIVLKNDPEKKVIGTVGLVIVSAKNRTFELAYALDEAHWGKGILVEASKVLIDYAFKHYALDRLQCRCRLENSQSARVMEKLGMKYEGIMRSAMYNKNVSSDLKMYSILKSEWKGRSFHVLNFSK